jgi:hypothetical protein
MKNEREIYNAIVIACIFGILIILVLTLFLKNKIAEEEAFSALFFNKHRELPHELELNKTYEFSFTLENHELNITHYVYEIDSKVKKFKKSILLLPGESAHIEISIKPIEKGWKIKTNITQKFEDKIDLIKDKTIIAREAKFKLLTNNISQSKYLPISHFIDKFGFIFHTNLSIEELKKKPFSKFYTKRKEGVDELIFIEQNITLFLKGDEGNEEIFLNSKMREEISLTKKEPFIVKVYKYHEESSKEEELEIHFWYEVT